MTLSGMRYFKSKTGKDLWATLLLAMETWTLSRNDLQITRMRKMYDAIDFETGCHLIKAIADTEDKRYPLEEIEDAMNRVGWLPVSENELEKHGIDPVWVNPWPIAIVEAAVQINDQFEEISKTNKKKADTLHQ